MRIKEFGVKLKTRRQRKASLGWKKRRKSLIDAAPMRRMKITARDLLTSRTGRPARVLKAPCKMKELGHSRYRFKPGSTPAETNTYVVSE